MKKFYPDRGSLMLPKVTVPGVSMTGSYISEVIAW